MRNLSKGVFAWLLQGIAGEPWQETLHPSILPCMKGLRRRSEGSAEALKGRIAAVLADIIPVLRIEHCRLEIEEFVVASGMLTVRVDGSCPDCLGSPAMFRAAIEAHLKQRVPEVREVVVADQ